MGGQVGRLFLQNGGSGRCVLNSVRDAVSVVVVVVLLLLLFLLLTVILFFVFVSLFLFSSCMFFPSSFGFTDK